MRIIASFIVVVSFFSAPANGWSKSLSPSPGGAQALTDGHAPQDLDQENAAYERHEKANVLSCYYSNSAFSSEREELDFISRNKIDLEQNSGSFSVHRFEGSAQLTSAFGGARISLLESANNGHLIYNLTIQADDGSSASTSGPPKSDRFSLPRSTDIRAPHLLDLYRKLKLDSVRCSVSHSDPFAFDEKDLAAMVHIIVHPHNYYDPQGKITSQINFWQNKPGVRTIALLEQRNIARTPNDIVLGVPFKPEKDDLTFTPNGQTRFAVAPNGQMDFVAHEGKFPTHFVLTGGWFNACVTHMLDSLFTALRANATNRTMSIDLPLDGLLVQPEGDGGNGYPGMSTETTLRELRSAHPKTFERLMEDFAENHIKYWEQDEDSDLVGFFGWKKRGLDVQVLDESGKSIVSKTWGGSNVPHDRITFRLVSD